MLRGHFAYVYYYQPVVYQQLPAYFTIINNILMRMSPDQADRMLRLFNKRSIFSPMSWFEQLRLIR